MKTQLFFGQDRCLNFGNIDEMLKWLREREMSKTFNNRCMGQEMGSDGSRRCSEGQLTKIRLAFSKSATGEDFDGASCPNHLAGYLQKGWVLMGKLCQSCCSNTCSPGWRMCEDCLDRVTTPKSDAQRLKDVGYCVNQGQVLGCSIHAAEGSMYCNFCTAKGWNHQDEAKAGAPEAPEAPAQVGSPGSRPALRPRVRSLPTASRPCNITEHCAGTMEAALRRFNMGLKPELWWTCAICKQTRVAQRSKALVDPNVQPALLEILHDKRVQEIMDATPEAVGFDKQEMAENISHEIRGLLE